MIYKQKYICSYFLGKKFLPEETDEGEIASALDGGVGVLVVRGATDEVVEDEVVVG